MLTPPPHPLAAVTHPDPSGYYADLAARPLFRDDTLGYWIAASAEAVTAVLTDPNCRVRPVSEPVPPALLGSPAEPIFRHLVRVNDGAPHCPLKRAVEDVFSELDPAGLQAESRHWAEFLGARERRELAVGNVGGFVFDLPAYVLSRLLGVPPEGLSEVARLMRDFVYCLSPASSSEQVERGKVAAGTLLELFDHLLSEPATRGARSLLNALDETIPRYGNADPSLVTANGIGFIWQSYEATAGLIGNTLLALARNSELHRRVGTDRELLRQVLLEVLRLDPPIQNTRRFVAQGGVVLGQNVQAGDIILVVLAAANLDPAANPNPGRFEVARGQRRLFTLGVGPHACPGQDLALTIAGAGIEYLLANGPDLTRFADRVTYRPSVNARIPVGRQEDRA